MISFSSENIRERMIDKTIKQTNIFEDTKNIFSPQHQVIYRSAYRIFNNNKVFGIGPKNYEYFCLNSKKMNSKINCGVHPHNYLIQTLTESGLLGFFFFYSFYFYLIFIFFRYYQMNKKENLIYIGSLGSIIIFYLPFLPSGNFYNGWLNTITFFNLGIFNIYFQKIIRN